LLYNLDEFSVLTREVKLLRKPPVNRRIKTVLKGRDLINVRLVLATSFVEYLFKLSNIYR
jgi:hypothetical protein